MVEEVRERVIRAAAYRPFEGASRVFVIEQAEAMREESQNALLKTLEEPPGFDHLLLLSAEPEALLETITSRCQDVAFTPLPPEAVAEALEGEGSPAQLTAAARLAAGDADRARLLLGEEGRRLRADAEELARSALDPERGGAPWQSLLEAADAAGKEAERAAREQLEEAEAGTRREIGEQAKRVGRRRRTEVLDFGLELCAAWLRDLGAVAAGAPEVVLGADNIEELAREAEGLDPTRARRSVELVVDTRRRLDLNVSEELALEALFFRLQATLGRTS
jgi:DNA polymerase III subunit delta'